MKRNHNRSRGGKGAATGSTAKITFNDPFTGADGSAVNARYSASDLANWTITSNKVHFTGAAADTLLASCTAGDNTISVDCDFPLTLTFGGIIFRYTDVNNYCYCTLGGTENLRIGEVVAGSAADLITDTGHTRLSTAATLTVVISGNSVNATVTGGSDPGTFGTTVTSNTSGNKIGLVMNTGKSTATYDNFILS